MLQRRVRRPTADAGGELPEEVIDQLWDDVARLEAWLGVDRLWDR